MEKLLVVIIHGIGSQSTDFAEECISKLKKELSKKDKDPTQIEFLPIYWANITELSQLRYFSKASSEGELDYRGLRKFVLTALGDASAYRKTDGTNDTYNKIHDLIDEELKNVVSNEGNSITGETPVIVLAHSLGGHIMSNHIWDRQREPNPASTPLENMETLSGLITFGCNIPLFTFAYNNIRPITFPPLSLPEELSEKAEWLNYYDPDDVLGYPLKPINDAYRSVVSEDIAISVGGILTAWNPASHTAYWTDKDFIRPVATYIANFI